MAKEKQDNFEVIDVATATEPMIKDKETNETYTRTSALCKMMNDIKEIKENVK